MYEEKKKSIMPLIKECLDIFCLTYNSFRHTGILLFISNVGITGYMEVKIIF